MAGHVGAKEKLINAAQTELICGNGQVEMLAVAKRAQLSVGLAYHHFGSKAGLIGAVVEAFYRQLDVAVFNDPTWPRDTWVEQERGRIGAYVAFHYTHPFAPLVIGPLSRSPEVMAIETAFTGKQLAGGAQMLIAAQRQGVVPDDIDPHLTIALMIGAIRHALIFAISSESRPQPDQLTDQIWHFIAAALRLPA